MKNYLIIGAGFSGAVLARELADAGHYVTVVDKRDHIGGNAYDCLDKETGVYYHKYGPHLFHTNNDEVFDWLSKFTKWVPYEHRVKARIRDAGGTDKYIDVTMPPNKETFEVFNHDKEMLINVLFRRYSRKMWGMELEQMDPTIIARLPMKPDSDDDRYFTDKHQYLPKYGYTQLFEEMLYHKNIKVSLGMSLHNKIVANFDHIFNCAPIDEWFDYKFGELPYRSMQFHHVRTSKYDVLPTATLNFSDDGPYTRVTEWNRLPNHTDELTAKTLLTYEKPCAFIRQETYNGVPFDTGLERYYPVKDATGENRERYKKYLTLVPENMTFIGRCGQYVYIDMHQAVNSSLQLAKKVING